MSFVLYAFISMIVLMLLGVFCAVSVAMFFMNLLISFEHRNDVRHRGMSERREIEVDDDERAEEYPE